MIIAKVITQTYFTQKQAPSPDTHGWMLLLQTATPAQSSQIVTVSISQQNLSLEA